MILKKVMELIQIPSMFMTILMISMISCIVVGWDILMVSMVGIIHTSIAIGDGDVLIGVHPIGDGMILGIMTGTIHGMEAIMAITVIMDGDGPIVRIIPITQVGADGIHRLEESIVADIREHTTMDAQRLTTIQEWQRREHSEVLAQERSVHALVYLTIG